jgi:predicted Zn-dependent protease
MFGQAMGLVKRWIATAAAAALVWAGIAMPVAAQQGQGQTLSLLRDAETENAIRSMATPLWRAAGLQPDAVRILLVNDPSLNAFVGGGQNLFIHAGLLMRAENAGQLLGVIAHETGHMAGGHLARLPDAYHNALMVSLLGLLAGAGAAVASHGGGGMGALAGAGDLGAREFMAFARGVENSADHAGLTFLDRTHMSAKGMLEFMEILEKQEFLSAASQDPYLRTHPLTSERVDNVRNWVAHSPYSDLPPPAEDRILFDRIRAKLVAFLQPPTTVLARYKENDTSVVARYARAIAYYRFPDLKRALPLIDGLIAEHGDDPYFFELKGQMLFENGRVGEAIEPYRRAVALLPDSALIKISFAQVELEANDPKLVKPAIATLEDARRSEADNVLLWRMLAVGYGRDGDIGMATVALSEIALLEHRNRDARDQAKRAQQLLPVGSRGYLTAQDIETASLHAIRDEKK